MAGIFMLVFVAKKPYNKSNKVSLFPGSYWYQVYIGTRFILVPGTFFRHLFLEEEREQMNTEVRYHMLRPEQIVEQRKACPVVYIPIGTLEWHGLHNAVGADTLQAEGIAIRCAQKGGGLVFPPLYYGETRLDGLMEANAADREKIAESMELPSNNFTPEMMPFSRTEQTMNYNRLLLHILAEANTLGFKVGILVAGHYPLIDHARAAVVLFNQSMLGIRGNGMLAWAFTDHLLLKDKYVCAGDHAGGWETSHMMALHPQTVDLNHLPPRGIKPIGVSGKMDPLDSSAEFGQEIIEKAAEIAVREAHHRLEHPEFYRRNGGCLDEGLWK